MAASGRSCHFTFIVLDEASELCPLQRSKVSNLAPNKPSYANTNRILEATAQLATNKLLGVEKVLTEARANQIISQLGSRENPSSGLYGHLKAIWQLAKSTANYLENLGSWDGKAKNPKIWVVSYC